jgi:hypothetical protein
LWRRLSSLLYAMKTHVEFRSTDFPPYESEAQELNPGRWGKRLAEFLVQGLPNYGFEPGAPIPEDWGWVVPIKNDGFRLWIGCGNLDEQPEGFLCFIEPHQPSIRKFLRKIDTSTRVNELREAIDQLMSASPNVREKRWMTYEEFNVG